MASRPSTFPPSYSFRSPLVKHQPESIPTVDELEILQTELRAARHRAMERRRKAVDDDRILEESIRRMTEKEKGKSKAVDKVKHERDCKSVLIPLCYHLTYYLSFLLLSAISNYYLILVPFNCSCRPQPSGSAFDWFLHSSGHFPNYHRFMSQRTHILAQLMLC